jgi:hypothetical protein
MHHVVEVPPHRAAFGRRLLRELAVTQYRAEDVVEVVCDPARERPHRFHFLRLAKLDLETILLCLRVLPRGDVGRRPDEAIRVSGRIANAAPASVQPVPFAIGMTYAIFRLVMIGPSLEMIAHRGFHSPRVVGMNVERSDPCFAGSDRGVHAAAMQHLHLRRQERGSLLEIPVERTLVRALHRECVALLALAQRSLAKLDSPDLVHQRGDRGGTEQHENQRTRRSGVGDFAPALECDAFLARHRHHQGKLRNVRHAHEPWLLIDWARLKSGGSGFRRDELGEFASHGLWRLRLAHHQRSVFAQQVDCAALTEVDRLIDTLECLEVDDRLHDAVEASIPLFEAPRHYDRGAMLDLRDQRFAQNDAKMRMVPVSDEIRPVGKGRNIRRQLSRSIARYSVLIDDPDLAHLLQTRGLGRQLVVCGTPGRGTLGFIPCDRIAQEEVGGLQRIFSLLGQRLGQICQFAVARRDGVVVRTPGIVGSSARESSDGQHADGDNPESQAGRARCVREQ